MKKLLLILALLLISVVVPINAETIGYIDMEVILRNYKDAKAFGLEIEELKEKYQETLEKRQKEIQKARDKGKKDEKIEEMITALEDELTPRRNEIVQKEMEFQRNLLGKVTSTAKAEAKKFGVDVILDKRVVLDGGTDLTEFVVDRLNQ